jgi:hypothetical protein
LQDASFASMCCRFLMHTVTKRTMGALCRSIGGMCGSRLRDGYGVFIYILST